MSVSHQILKELIDKLESYEQLNPENPSTEDFLTWVVENKLLGVPYELKNFENLDVALNKELVILSRFARFHLKRGFAEGLIQSPDELGYLAVLLSGQSYTKIGLIEANIHEKTTGMEIIKRLLRLGLIQQREDPDDKRSKLLAITELGRQEVLKHFQALAHTMTIIAGNLSQKEKQTLLALVNKLNLHHKKLLTKMKGN